MKIDIKTSMRMIVGRRKLLLVINLKSSRGECVLFSITINIASDTPDAVKSQAT
ncbi:MAG: hypothetical protein WBV84_10725 [Nitrososphaeraceae archaeon]